ncbi:MAG TPA: class I SAM-dependent methyltransferase [Wenzhouxiangellaceae bacterium]|nr:class I SAM-dependent methyltransferase [Wenzhouxiangellaceae bacterium]
MKTRDTESWDRYWKSGRGAACQADDDGLYAGVINDRWTRLFSSLDGPNRILDLACGNGALARIAARSDSASQIEMHCVDAASIRPDFSEPGADLSRCRQYPKTRNEQLPFAARMFDGCVSQYGFEYGEPESTVTEVARVLKPGGWVHLICHWAAGDIARDADDEVRRGHRLRALQLPERIAALVQLQQQGGQYIPQSHQRTWHLPEALRLKQGLAEGFSIARSTPQQATGNLGLFLHNLAHLYQHREQHPAELMAQKMRECDEELRHHLHRLEALAGAALTREDVDRLRTLLDRHGIRVHTEDLLREPATDRIVGIEFHAGGRAAPAHSAGIGHHPGAPHWSEYWQGGSATTFGAGRFEQHYDDTVESFWRERVAALPDDTRIVDLGCGNGAVVAMLAKFADQLDRRWTLIGVDAADVQAGKVIALSNLERAHIEILSRTPMESTGIEAASVDLVAGTFGLEYGDPAGTIAELTRITRPGGGVAAIFHHPDSAVSVQARENVRAVDRLLDELRFPQLIAAIVRSRFGQRPGPDDAAEAEVATIVSELEAGGPGSYPLQVARHFLSAAEPQGGILDDRLRFVEQFTRSLQAWRDRMNDMAEATMDAPQFERWLGQLRAGGFSNLDVGTLRHSHGGLLGRTLVARRD